MTETPVIPTGRLAPSPTGRLHVGNLASAVLAWIQVRRRSGRLVMRIEDIDTPRVVDGAEEELMDDLRWLGLDWDEGPDVGGPNGPYRQSERGEFYARALAELAERGLVYPCFCSRREIDEVLSAPHADFDPSTQYPGTCAHLPAALAAERTATEPYALRFRARGVVRVEDGIAGSFAHQLFQRPGDFVVRRRDGLFAYQLVVVADDVAMNVTDVLRGRDLLDSTPRQLAIFDALDAARPETWHVPMMTDERGERLSKRAASVARGGLEAAGWSPELLVGALCHAWGWTSHFEGVSLEESVALWDPATLNRPEIRVPNAFFEGPRAYARHTAGLG